MVVCVVELDKSRERREEGKRDGSKDNKTAQRIDDARDWIGDFLLFSRLDLCEVFSINDVLILNFPNERYCELYFAKPRMRSIS